VLFYYLSAYKNRQCFAIVVTCKTNEKQCEGTKERSDEFHPSIE